MLLARWNWLPIRGGGGLRPPLPTGLSPQSSQNKKPLVKHISETLPTDESIQPSEYELYKVTSGTSGNKPFEVDL